MSSEYYPLDKTAEMLALTTGEVTRLRERGELRAFRDGTSWKFRKVDVDNRVAQSIRERGAAAAAASSEIIDSDVTIEVPPQGGVDAIDFDDSLDVAGDGLIGLSLAPVAAAPAAPAAAKPVVSLDKKQPPSDDLALAGDALGGDAGGFDSDLLIEESPSMAAAAALEQASDDDSDFAVSDEVSSNLTGESSSELNVAVENDDDEDDLLALVDDDLGISVAKPAKPEPQKPVKQPAAKGKSAGGVSQSDSEGFDLDNFDILASEDSESASAVIPVEENSNPFGIGGDDIAPDFTADDTSPPFGGSSTGETTSGGGADPFSTGGGFESVAATPAARPTTSAEPEYSWQTITFGLIPCLIIVCLSMAVMFDLILHIWSWGQPSGFSGALIGLLSGMLF